MEKLEFIKQNKELFNEMIRNNITPYHVAYVDICEDYKRMKAQNLKRYYIMRHLSDKYGFVVRQIYQITKMLCCEME